MLNIALYSNNSLFLTEFSKGLSGELRSSAGGSCRIRKLPIQQTTLFDEAESVFDLCVVDLQEDARQGLKLIRALRSAGSCEIMVVASSSEYAMAAYDLDVMSYFLAPPDYSRAAAAILRRFSHRLVPRETQFSFKTASGMRVLSAERIVYVEYSDHRMIVYTDMGKKLATTTMRLSFGEAASQLLEDSRFVRTHASFIVNIMHISQFGQSVLLMDTGVTVPVSHGKRREVKQHFNSFFNRPTTGQGDTGFNT